MSSETFRGTEPPTIPQLEEATLEALREGLTDSAGMRSWIAGRKTLQADTRFTNLHAWALVNLQRNGLIRKTGVGSYALAEHEPTDLVDPIREGEPLPPWARKLVSSAILRNRSLGEEGGFSGDDLRALWKDCKGKCAVSGLPFRERKIGSGKAQRVYAPSLDRKDPNRGYTRDNCWLVMVGVNFAMNRWGLDTYLELAEASINHLRETST
jgi:hypothetical protein